MKAYRGVEEYFYPFLTTAVAGGEWLALRPGQFIPSKERRLGPRTCLNVLEKRKLSPPRKEFEPSDCLARSRERIAQSLKVPSKCHAVPIFDSPIPCR